MKVSKKVEDAEKAQELSIEEATKMYAVYAREEKAAKSNAAKYKELIINYATANPEKFAGKTLALPNGVSVEARVSQKATWNEDVLSLGWIEKACDVDLEDAVKVKIDPKALPETLTKKQRNVLSYIAFEVTEVETLAVCVS